MASLCTESLPLDLLTITFVEEKTMEMNFHMRFCGGLGSGLGGHGLGKHISNSKIIRLAGVLGSWDKQAWHDLYESA